MQTFEGTWTLVCMALRRERVIAPVWIAVIILIVAGMGANYARVFPTDDLRQSFMAEMTRNRVLLAFAGQLAGPNLGAMTVWRIGDTAYTLVALLSVLTVVRHTRGEEESGRFELVGATAVGRNAPLAASLVVACALSGATGALTAVALAGNGFDPVGSIAFGLAVAGIGWVFAAVAAVSAQLTDSARTDTVIAITVLACSYLMRFVADGSGQVWLKWFTPHGRSHLVEPFGVERWSALGLIGAGCAILVGGAFGLIVRRDLGAGILPSRLGPASGPGLRSPLALAWRLQRGLLFAWMIGFAVGGAALGAMAATLPDVIRGSGWGQEFLSRYSGNPRASIVDIFLELIIVSLAMTVTFYPVLATLRLHGEEVAGRAELVLSNAVSHVRWAVSHLAVVLLGTMAVLATGGATLGLAHGLAAGGDNNVALELGRVLVGALLHVPAAWLLAGIAMLLYGALPRYAAPIAWAVLMYVQLVGEVFGPVILGPAYSYQVANGLQPFHWIPKITSGGELSLTPLLVLTVLTALLVATGLGAFRRRDVGA